jgi:5-methylcytosine-specific restriction endonuclease McrA
MSWDVLTLWALALVGLVSLPHWWRLVGARVRVLWKLRLTRWRHRHATGPVPRERIRESWRAVLWGEQCGRCAACWEPLSVPPWPVDHIVPVHRGGVTQLWNLQTLCSQCHGVKTSREGGGEPKVPRVPLALAPLAPGGGNLRFPVCLWHTP